MLKLLKKFNKSYKSLNGNKVLLGLALIFSNIFSKYITVELSKTQEEFVRNLITREIIIFLMLVINTGDILLSIVVTAAFVILANTLFNEKSKLCIIPKKYIHLEDVLDLNKDSIISTYEIDRAKDILSKAKS